MNLKRFFSILCISLTFAAIAHLGCRADTPFISADNSKSARNLNEYISAASNALRFGMTSFAEIICRSIISEKNPPQKELDETRDILISALISQGKYDLASQELSLIKKKPDSIYHLKSALISIGLVQISEAEDQIAKSVFAELPEDMQSWYYLARGYIFYHQAKYESARKNFEKSQELAKTKFAYSDSMQALNLARLSQGLTDSDTKQMLEDLSRRVNIYLGTPTGFSYAKQYAIVLNKVGKKDEALKLIDGQLQLPLITEFDIEDLKIISAILQMDNPEKSKMVLKDVLLSTKSADILDYALKLLHTAFATDNAGFEQMLKEILSKGSENVRDRILLELAFCSIQNSDIAATSKYASELLENYPASQLKKDALRILTWVSFLNPDSDPTKYRLAAKYLLEIAALETNQTNAFYAKMLAADSYLKDNDFYSAATIYEELINHGEPKNYLGRVLVNAVDSLVAAKSLDKAIVIVDKAYKNNSISTDETWEAEWSLLNGFRAEDKIDQALLRVEKILSDPAYSKISILLKFRMQWLQAKLNEEKKHYNEAVKLSNILLEEIFAVAISEDEKAAVDNLAASTMLLKARCLLAQGKTDGKDGAFACYEALRAKYPFTDAAQMSALYQARALAAKNQFAAAAQMCKTLVDTYPDSKFASTAIFEAAHYARQMGTDSNYKNALVLLDNLCKNYPTDGKVFYARFMQGDILRILGSFADARAIYQDLQNAYPNHPEIYLAAMAIGDTLLAQKNKELDASLNFERLYALSNIPLEAKAEAAFKWGFAMQRMGRKREAAEIWWLTSKELLNVQNTFESKGKYWIGRMLLELGKTLEDLGQPNDAKIAYKLIIENKLAGSTLAEKKLNSNTK